MALSIGQDGQAADDQDSPNVNAAPETENIPPTARPQRTSTIGHDSLVTVRLSEPPPPLSVNTDIPLSRMPTRRTIYPHICSPEDELVSMSHPEEPDGTPTPLAGEPLGANKADPSNEEQQDDAILLEPTADDVTPESSSGEEDNKEEEDEVDWEVLEKTEESQPRAEHSENSTVLLLARLEQENNKIATNPKSGRVEQILESTKSSPRDSRPPSMANLRQMAYGPTPPALRYSMLPPPPMTDLEFYAALVKDYHQTAARLPTLLTHKIRKGIPPPLRGVVWQSMAGARDPALEEVYEKLSGESSPYEGIIGKDLGRSFPGVDMFRDPEGDGQRMLGRVLKCFSLYDQKIGYCQGLAFLVGPLLMHMPEKQAFCVLVRLMESYGLRSCFLPDLAGLHVRLYQFRELLRETLPVLSSHLDDLQVDPAYVSQWFLSFFAVTSPLPMLFRIYDVIFAEGAGETIMRVALALMRKNQSRILACAEMEDAVHLLLSRGLWDCYQYSNADEFVSDFVGLTSIVTAEKLSALEQGYDQQAQAASSTNVSASSATSRFLGRLWSISASSTISTANLSPWPHGVPRPNTSFSQGSRSFTAPLGQLSMLQRSASKHSVASTLNSMEAGGSSASVLSSSTDATTVSRDSSGDERLSSPTIHGVAPKSLVATNSSVSDTKHLHNQIEDLLTALSDLQRTHSLLTDQLQKEREERAEDRRAVQSLLLGLRAKNTITAISPDPKHEEGAPEPSAEFAPSSASPGGLTNLPSSISSDDQLEPLIEAVEYRFGQHADSRRSSVPQTKVQLRDELARAKELLSNETGKTQVQGRRLQEQEEEISTLKDQLRESHTHLRSLHQDKQRLEKQMHGMRVRASADAAPSRELDTGDWFGRSAPSSFAALGASAPPATGLRELKLARSRSTPSQAASSSAVFSRRGPSLAIKGGAAESDPSPAMSHDNEALLLDLVQAKTAEAVARQEADEMRQKLESLKKAFGLAVGDTPPGTALATATAGGTAAAASAAMGMIGRFTNSVAESAAAKMAAPSATQPTAAGAQGGFWGWRRGQ